MLFIHEIARIFAVIILLFLIFSSDSYAFAISTGVEQLENSSAEIQHSEEKNRQPDLDKTIDKDHWIYKTLGQMCENHKISGISSDSKNRDYITREEAAVLLINIIEQTKNELTSKENIQIDILKQELNREVQCIFNRVASLESSVNGLSGSLSKLEQSDKKNIKFFFGDKLHIGFGSQVLYAGITEKGASDFPANFSLPTASFYIEGKLIPHLDYYGIIDPSIPFDAPIRNAILESYVSTDIIPHHNVIFGRFLLQIGEEAPRAVLFLDTVTRAQISRNFQTLNNIGTQVEHHGKYLDYYLSLFNGTGKAIITPTTEKLLINTFGRSMNYGERAVFRPFGYNEKLGTLELGSGYFVGKRTNDSIEVNYNTLSFYTGYKRKKNALTAEYAQKKGYITNGQSALGWYVNDTYNLTNKIQLVARYDRFYPNSKIKSSLNTEYTIGANYYRAGPNVKYQLNYVLVTIPNMKMSQRILLLGQFLF